MVYIVSICSVGTGSNSVQPSSSVLRSQDRYTLDDHVSAYRLFPQFQPVNDTYISHGIVCTGISVEKPRTFETFFYMFRTRLLWHGQ